MQGGEYGKTRLWGAVGWGGFSPLGGLLVDRVGEKGAFWGNLVGCALGLLPTLLSPVQVGGTRKQYGAASGTPVGCLRVCQTAEVGGGCCTKGYCQGRGRHQQHWACLHACQLPLLLHAGML